MPWFDPPEVWEENGTLPEVVDCGNCGEEIDMDQETGEAYCAKCDGYTCPDPGRK